MKKFIYLFSILLIALNSCSDETEVLTKKELKIMYVFELTASGEKFVFYSESEEKVKEFYMSDIGGEEDIEACRIMLDEELDKEVHDEENRNIKFTIRGIVEDFKRLEVQETILIGTTIE